jgi:hypothetical protein
MLRLIHIRVSSFFSEKVAISSLKQRPETQPTTAAVPPLDQEFGLGALLSAFRQAGRLMPCRIGPSSITCDDDFDQVWLAVAVSCYATF